MTSLDSVARFSPAASDSVAGYPHDRCVHELFDAQAMARPRASAALHAGWSLSYRELKLRSEALAVRLRAAGVARGDNVGVCGARSLEALVAFVGILKAGAAYMPLDDTTPPERLRMMAEDAGVHVAVTLPGSVCRLRRLRTRIDVAGVAPAGIAASAATPAATPEVVGADCAYVMFTSGSTGRPKPVAIPHRGVLGLVRSDCVTQRPRPGERVLHAYGLSSDASTIEIWSALLNGACLVLVDREELLSSAALETRLRAEGVTVAYLTTGVFHHVARTRPGALRTLRFVSAGGEAMDPELTRAVQTACPDTTVVNFYGPTENTVVSTAYLVRELPAGLASVPIGRALEHCSCYVLRADGALARVGEEGELYVGGEGLALGYVGDPELSAARFVENPLQPGSLLYRTGDRARWRSDGELEYRGRLDRQVKLRGHRIELDGIEARLRAHDSVGEAIVDLDGETLIGYLTPAHPGRSIPVDRVRQDLLAWLPATAVPARLIQVAQFPVTTGGKIDRPLLRAWAGAGPGRPPSARPRDTVSLTDTLAGIWQMVLRVQPAVEDNFFDLGGDSLLAAEAITRTLTVLNLDARYGTALIRDLLRTPTLAGFTRALKMLLAEQALADRPATESSTHGSELDFSSEGRLGFAVAPRRGPMPRPLQPKEVLLTGASGFVGAFLLDRLLRASDARVHCPVRSRDPAHATQRVLTNLARYGLTPPDSLERVVCFPADLSEPRLGLSGRHADELASTLDLVIHSAARANFLYPYHALRRANVDGTREVVRLAAGRRVPVHFLSTIAVLAGFGTAGVRHVDEDLPLAYVDRLTMGYAESKWVAEHLLGEAADHGVPVAIYRPYEITGDRRSGACNTETAICSLFAIIAETGLAPDIPLPMDFVPVDYVANAVVNIATSINLSTQRTYHLTNPQPATLADMLDRMRATGHHIQELPYHDWVAELVRHVSQHPTSPTAPFVSLCVDQANHTQISVKEMYLNGTFPELGRANIQRDLANSGLDCPPVDAALLDRYLQYFYSTGYIRHPGKA